MKIGKLERINRRQLAFERNRRRERNHIMRNADNLESRQKQNATIDLEFVKITKRKSCADLRNT